MGSAKVIFFKRRAHATTTAIVADWVIRDNSFLQRRADTKKTEEEMNYYGAAQLAESFRTVRKNTILIAEDIPEEKYTFAVTPGTRSVEKLLTHIGLAPRFQLLIHSGEPRSTLDGFNFPVLMQEMMAEEAKPRTKGQVIELLQQGGETWANFVAGLKDEFLGQSVTMPQGATPPARTRFDMILSVKEHEMHHRGQLMIVERMIGIVPHLTRDMQARMAQAQQQAQRSSKS